MIEYEDSRHCGAEACGEREAEKWTEMRYEMKVVGNKGRQGQGDTQPKGKSSACGENKG